MVRLKGGDPFVFGRGSEEALYLARAGIAYEVVPGITAAAGCAAAAGIPLTHRGLATGVRFATGHCRDDRDLDLDWRGLADPDTTLVVYMGLANIAAITRNLIAAGLAPSTPTAAVANGTLAGQSVIATSLGTLEADLAACAIEPPVTVIIGRVAAFARRPAPELGDRDWHLADVLCHA